MKEIARHILAGLCLIGVSGAARAGDEHPHRTITISGQCQSCDLARENLYGAEIIGATFIASDLNDANLNHSVQVETRFIGSSLNRADFTTSRLSGVMFQESELEGAVLVSLHGERLRFDGSIMTGVDLTDSLLILANFMETDLTDSSFVRTRLFNSRFDGATLDGANFTAANLPGAIMRGTEGRDVNFSEADMRGVDLSGAHFVRADFSGAVLQGARLEGTIMIEVTGLTPEALRDACSTAASQLPDGIELRDCSELPQRTTRAPEPRRPLRLSFTTSGPEQNVFIVRDAENVQRIEEIRAEQARAVAEFEAVRRSIVETRRAMVEAESILRDTEIDIGTRQELAAEIEEELREVREMEIELQVREADFADQMRSNPDMLRLVRQSGERLIFIDETGSHYPDPRSPSVVVNGNRYQLNGRYEWVFEMPASEPLGPKGPGEAPAPPPAPESTED
ncbi:pentapeptide repeat-containing protein [Hyphobacterium sp. HN65]|uniref:Pentapeptide repeat-containing protein n=1 Tax=Hyphobacterium lacteum TaxID=3116575 RepID=A0ABU7LLJ6_9PROT|nr:pentapeptide repeat-containing protein [Hyphobacterium sp. HN65]MEE2524800.1 pentapeptide repeat-containing protein [Hyphobacterium sp. HN65]